MMMSLIMAMSNYFDRTTSKLKWWHIGYIKTAVIFFTLLLLKFFPILLALEWYFYLAGLILFSLPIFYRVFLWRG